VSRELTSEAQYVDAAGGGGSDMVEGRGDEVVGVEGVDVDESVINSAIADDSGVEQFHLEEVERDEFDDENVDTAQGVDLLPPT
jgi:hypothetical protein